MRILVTGASGFVGSGLVPALLHRAHEVTALTRQTDSFASPVQCITGRLESLPEWRTALHGQQAVIHCAARVHVMQQEAPSALAQYRAVNRDASLALAQAAAESGVQRFIYLSSIKVNGEHSQPNQPFRATDIPAPTDPYAQSKLEAEQGLEQIAAQTGMELVIIRPVLVYGPGVKANLQQLMRGIALGLPWPFARLDNRRSLLARDNLVDLLCCCLEHPAAAGQIFLASDGEDLSTPELIRTLAQAMGRPDRLWACPPAWLERATHWPVVGSRLQRLCGSLQVDISATRARLNWKPPVSVYSALRQMVRHDWGQPTA